MIKEAGSDESNSRRSLISFFRSYFFFSAIVFSVLITFVIEFDYSFRVKKYSIGDVVESDIEAPFSYTVINRVKTEERIRDEIKRVLPIFVKDDKAYTRAVEKVLLLKELLKKGRKAKIEEFAKTGIRITKKDLLILLSYGPKDFEKISTQTLKILYTYSILSEKNIIPKTKNTITVLNSEGRRENIRVKDILSREEALEFISGYILENFKNYNSSYKKAVIKIISQIVISNIIYDKEKNEEMRNFILKNVPPVLQMVKKGQIIARKGDIVNENSLRLIEELQKKLNENKRTPVKYFFTFFYVFLVIFSFSLILNFSGKKNLSGLSLNSKKIYNIVLFNVFVFIFIYKIYILFEGIFHFKSAIENSVFFLSIPFEISALSVAFLTSSSLAFVVIALSLFLTGNFFFTKIFNLLVVAALSFLSAYGIESFGRRSRSSIIKSSIYIVLPAGAFLILVGSFIFEEKFILLLFIKKIVFLLVGVLTASAFSSILVPAEETIFDIYSSVKIMEIANLDNPILREMSIKAPGTYHHSMMVALLVENAGKALSLDPVLLQAQAMYHDIGKIKAPEYFIENQLGGENIHDKLPPQTSVAFIKKHISDGKIMAEKLGLPEPIIKAIEEHHGTSLIKYFFNKELEQNDAEKVDEKLYRYSGPKPSSKETALLMLADSVEAASKSLKVITDEKIKEMIDEIFDKIIKDGQLNNAPITLKDIEIIKKSFFDTLKSSAHLRVSYPGYKFSEEEKDEGGNNSKNKKNKTK